ncbi:MAG: hypothetical protein IIV06_04135 [Alistipes sp.]|nr:hypothetical protein [Alistipes sp.]
MAHTKIDIKKLVPAAVAVVLFWVISALYFAPQLGGDRLAAHDTVQYEGMSHDIKTQRATLGEDPQWTGAMFGGMPAYLIDVSYPAQLVVQTIGRVKNLLGQPIAFLFFAMLSMWVMLLICGVDPWLSMVGAVAYGLSTYFVLIIGAGHVTKMWAMVWAPMMMGGVWMALRGRMWPGVALAAVASSLEIGANHPQITYYFLMAMAAFWLSELVVAWREKHLPDFAKRTVLLAVAGILAVVSNLSPLWYTMQHTPDTIRGGSELAVEQSGEETDGLDLQYATAWSYGQAESWNMLIPDFVGRDSSTTFSSTGEVAATLSEMGLNGLEQQLPTYWGGQPYTGGPTYLGAAALFLAVLGLLLVEGRNRWWMVVICVLMLFLAWGKNWMGFTELFFNYLPGYNKFRTVSMTLVIWQWAVPLLGALALAKLLDAGRSVVEKLKAVAWAAGITAGLCLVMIVAGGALFSFGEAESAELLADYLRQIFSANRMQEYIARGADVAWGEEIAASMKAERVAMMQADAWRSLAMILLSAGAVWLFVKGKLRKVALAAVLVGIVVVDLAGVDMRFLSHDDFVAPSRRKITMTAADKAILQDKELGYRVLNLTVSPFNDATTSYFHRSVGGYHGAKLSRYQDLIDHYLQKMDEGVLDMLNTRYLIVQGESGTPEPRLRPTAYGAAWFVDEVVSAPTAQSEMEFLGQVDLRRVAVVNGKDNSRLTTPRGEMAEAEIVLEEYRPNYLRYRTSTPTEGVAVFSEIYYDKGWKAYIDGVEADYVRADYVLRAMNVPEGEHTIEWRFKAPAWSLIEGITLAASLLILLGALAVMVWEIRRLCKQ